MERMCRYLRRRSRSPARRGPACRAVGWMPTSRSGLPINLATAMQLAGVRPLDIAAATAQVEQALALQLQAKALWIPEPQCAASTTSGTTACSRTSSRGENFRKGRQSFFVGGGPFLYVGLTDAIFAPLAARRVVDVAAGRSPGRAERRPAHRSRRRSSTFRRRGGGCWASGPRSTRAELLVNFAKGLAPSLIAPLEINRAQTELQSLRQTQQVAIRDWRVASAQLAEVLLLEPATLLEPIEPPFLQVTLVPCDQTPEELVPIAVNNRPEIASRRELVAAAEQLLRQEKNRPFLPEPVSSSARPRPRVCSPAGNFSAGPNGLLNSNGSASISRSPRSGSCGTAGSAISA